MVSRKADRGDSPARRRTRARLKELLLQAAEEVLERDGLGFNTDTVTYKTVFAHLQESQGIRVTRGSVHERIWDSQRDFQLEVLRRAARWTPEFSNEALVENATRILDEADLTTEAGRRAAYRGITRDAAREVFISADADDHWPHWIGLTLALADRADADLPEAQLMTEGARASYEDMTTELKEIYRGIMHATRGRIRKDLFPDPEQALVTMTRFLTALADGMSLREQFEPESVEDVEFRPEGQHEPERWHPFSLSAWAICQFFTEPIPESEPNEESRDQTPS